MSRSVIWILLIACLARGVVAQEKEYWPAPPPADIKPTPADKLARTELLKLLEKKQSPKFAKEYKVIVPQQGTGLPDDYDVLVFGRYLDLAPHRLEVRVRGGKVMAELATDVEIRRGELPADTVDTLVRQLIYGFLARHESRRKDDEFSSGPMWSSYGSHSPYVRAEVRSTNPKFPFHMRIKDWQLLGDDLDSHTAGVYGFSHTRFCTELRKLAAAKLPVLEPTPEVRKELIARLKKITPPPDGGREDDSLDADPATLPLDYYRRKDLASTEALIYSQLAIAWREKGAADALRRLYLREAEQKLDIVTAEDPRELLKAALQGEDWRLYRFALQFLEDAGPLKHTEVVVRSLPHAKDEYRREQICSVLEDAELSAEQIAAVEAFHKQASDGRSQIAAARLLLYATQRDEFYDELRKLVDKLPDAKLAGKASDALLSYSIEKGKRREDSLAFVRSQMDHPEADGPKWSYYLARLGNRDDLPRLRRFCALKLDVERVSVVILDIAYLDAGEALELARARISELIDGSGDSNSLRWNVAAYEDLIFWQHDTKSIELIEKAVAKYRDANHEDGWFDHFTLLLKYLRAESATERLPLALEYVRQHRPSNDEWIIDVGEQLVAAGADPAACQELLKPKPRRKRR